MKTIFKDVYEAIKEIYGEKCLNSGEWGCQAISEIIKDGDGFYETEEQMKKEYLKGEKVQIESGTNYWIWETCPKVKKEDMKPMGLMRSSLI